MASLSHHECLIYDGHPSRQFPGLAALIREKLSQNYRCLYLNSQLLVSAFASSLTEAGVDVAYETKRGSLVLSSGRGHLQGDWEFDIDRMVQMLQKTLQQALDDGFQGLWATGDMTWEFGPQKDLSKLIEYELRLEEFLRQNPQMGGVCQYHADTLPRDIVRKGLILHPKLFVDQSLTVVNPHYVQPEGFAEKSGISGQLDGVIDRIFREQSLASC